MNRKVLSAVEDGIGGLSREKTKLLKLLLEERTRKAQVIPRCPRNEIEGAVRLATSWAQQRLWFIAQLEGGSTAYNTGVAMRLRGTLDRPALGRALDALVRRHEALRTVFVTVDDDPKQQIVADGSFALTDFDLSDPPQRERERKVELHKMEESHARFNLRVGPLIRGRLLRLAAEEHVLLITMHHIISDGWSKAVLVSELAQLYAAYLEGASEPLSPLPIQYADYAHWQRQWLQGDVLDKQLSYWREQLAGCPPELQLPTERPRPTVQSYKGETVRVTLDADLSRKLRALAQRHHMTLFMVLYCAWSILLARLSGQDDISTGTPVANRPRPELEALIGFFVNTLVLRLRVHPDASLEELLQQAKNATLGAYEHQDVPFEKVVDALQPQRTLSRNPLFQVMFALQNAPRSELSLPGLAATLEGGVYEASMFDLMLFMEESGEEIVGNLNYATDLFERETVERWLACFRVLLHGLSDPTRSHARVAELPLLPDSERHRVLDMFNAGAVVSELPHKTIHAWFEEQVQRAPDAVAVVDGTTSLTYAELNAKANQLARHLETRGVAPDRLVGLCVERSLDLVVGLLGILKAGGAYVPLDPNYPIERLAYILRDAQPAVLLIQSRFRERLPGGATQVIALDDDWSEIAANPGEDGGSATAVTPRHAAYVIYTSGSTGEPKGVVVEHRNVTRLFTSTQHWFNFGPQDVWTLFHSFAFDFSVWEMWGALLYGGRVVVVPYLTARSPHDFYRLLCREGVTVLNQTPSAFAQLIDAQGRSAEKHSLRVVIFGGEALELHTLRPWVHRNSADRPELVNMYGITETTVHVTYRRLTQSEIESERGSLIGRSIPDLRIYLLDQYRQPVPIGVAGEIYVGGAGVARGYLHRPELSAQRFVPDPFCSDPAARLYRSGDLARWRADGQLEYLGRNDHQVKIRGFRIELEEIEMQLARHQQVKDVVVIARQAATGDKRLVAYLIPASAGEPPTAATLHSYLMGVLPEYMVPSAFVMLERFPLTSNGKLDRAALPAPDEGAVSLRDYVAPRDKLEHTLCEIWAQVLGLARVGIADNFFAIGGDSILTLRATARAEALGLAVTIADLFRNQTIAQLANALRARVPQSSPAEQRAAPFELLSAAEREQFVGMAEIEDAYPLTLMQEGMYFHSELSPSTAIYHDVFNYRIEAAFSREHFERAVNALLQRHPMLRMGFVTSCDQRLVQVVHKNAAAAVHVFDISQLSPSGQEQSIEQWVAREKHQRFVWSEPPLLRFFIHVRGATRFHYSLSFHHSILDGWSVASLQTELMNHYFSLLDGAERVIDAPRTLYRDYVAGELRVLRSEGSREFWRQLLEGASASPLPAGVEASRRRGEQVVWSTVDFDASIGARLESCAQRLGVPMKLLLLAAHVKVMSAITAQQTVLTGVVSHGRLAEADGERVLGLHLNSLPLRIELADGSWRQLVLQLRDLEEAMLPHRLYPLAAIQELVRSERLIDTLFNFTRFHVYRQIEQSARVIKTGGFEQTNFAMLVNFSQQLDGPGIALAMSYDPAIFDRLQVERIGGYFERALISIIADVDAPHARETLLSDAERRELLVEFNGTASPYRSGRLIHELFEEQVSRTPQGRAVECGEQWLTYEELNGRANELARHLRERGVGADQRVGICVERSLEMVVGVLGILKAGAAYVPLDPSYPAERLQYMVADAAPQVVLTQRKLRAGLPPTSAEVVALDGEWEERRGNYGRQNLSSQELALSAQNLVYVIYTSGSTGRPKGTAMPHGSMVNLIEWHRERFGESVGKRVLQYAALSFDVAFQEIFSTLCTGGCLVMLDEWVRRDARALSQLLQARAIQRLFVPPLMLQSLAEALKDSAEAPSELEDVITAGEQLRLSAEIVSVFERLPGCRLHNHYGPTETHVVTALTLEGDAKQWPLLPSIGRPIANTQIYVLDEHRQVVPVGVAGEIYIGGANVARGYLNRDELTQQRFIADEFSEVPGARLYRTGDVGRWRADGTIEYLGRNDDQVKIRGYRIELGEIEAQLASHEQVREAAVVAREEVAGERYLVAYVTWRDPQEPASVEALREYLKQRLPQHMVPGAVVSLERLPLTPSGKLERRSLPAPQLSAYVSRQYEPPQGEIEQALAQIWQELLRVERVGRHDNFFELGGHSLHGIKLIAKVAERFGAQLPVIAVFQHPSIEQMAQTLDPACPSPAHSIGVQDSEQGVL